MLSAIRAAESFPTVAGGLLLTDELLGGVRVAAWPEHGIVKVEGRLSALLDRSATSYRLCSRDELRMADAAPSLRPFAAGRSSLRSPRQACAKEDQAKRSER